MTVLCQSFLCHEGLRIIANLCAGGDRELGLEAPNVPADLIRYQPLGVLGFGEETVVYDCKDAAEGEQHVAVKVGWFNLILE